VCQPSTLRTSISLLVVIGVRADGQKMLLAIKSMRGESTEAWRAVLDDRIKRGLRRPQFLIVDGAPGLEKALAAVWEGVPVQRCTVHKHRNLLVYAPALEFFTTQLRRRHRMTTRKTALR
jgi:putative transposase